MDQAALPPACSKPYELHSRPILHSASKEMTRRRHLPASEYTWATTVSMLISKPHNICGQQNASDWSWRPTWYTEETVGSTSLHATILQKSGEVALIVCVMLLDSSASSTLRFACLTQSRLSKSWLKRRGRMWQRMVTPPSSDHFANACFCTNPLAPGALLASVLGGASLKNPSSTPMKMLADGWMWNSVACYPNLTEVDSTSGWIPPDAPRSSFHHHYVSKPSLPHKLALISWLERKLLHHQFPIRNVVTSLSPHLAPGEENGGRARRNRAKGAVRPPLSKPQ
jgi:hypothetical protein